MTTRQLQDSEKVSILISYEDDRQMKNNQREY